MSNIDTSFENVNDDPANQPTENPNIRQLREKANRVDDLEAKLARYEQAETIRNAGLDLNERQQKALLAAHDGESTPEALLKTAQELGFANAQTPNQTQTEAPVQQPTISAEEQAAHAASASAATGAVAPGQQPLEDQYKTAKNAAELTAMIHANGGKVADDFE